MIRDLQLRDSIAELPAVEWSGFVYRACWEGRDVLQGSSGGGRWCPRNSFEVLYTSLDKNGAIAEVDAWLSEMTPRPDRPISVHKIDVQTKKTTTIADLDVLAHLGVDVTRYTERFYGRTQQIGDAVHFLENDGMLVPSARWECLNLVLFGGNHFGDQTLRSVESEIVDWDLWSAQYRS